MRNKAILRAADKSLQPGKSMLAKILKGSKDKSIEYGLAQCPVYEYYGKLTLQEITNRIDWMIEKGFLEIEYSDRLPLLVFQKSAGRLGGNLCGGTASKLTGNCWKEGFQLCSEVEG